MSTKSSALVGEKRFAPRRKRQLPAAIYFDGVSSGVRCTILDFSTTGARIKVERGWDAALRHTGSGVKRARLVELAERVTYECHVVRTGPEELGVHFAAPPVLPAAPAPKRAR